MLKIWLEIDFQNLLNMKLDFPVKKVVFVTILGHDFKTPKFVDFRIIQEHPALAQAASHVIAAVTEETNTRHLSHLSNPESAEIADLERVDPGVCFFIMDS